jgi:hypothetical protein
MAAQTRGFAVAAARDAPMLVGLLGPGEGGGGGGPPKGPVGVRGLLVATLSPDRGGDASCLATLQFSPPCGGG